MNETLMVYSNKDWKDCSKVDSAPFLNLSTYFSFKQKLATNWCKLIAYFQCNLIKTFPCPQDQGNIKDVPWIRLSCLRKISLSLLWPQGLYLRLNLSKRWKVLLSAWTSRRSTFKSYLLKWKQKWIIISCIITHPFLFEQK